MDAAIERFRVEVADQPGQTLGSVISKRDLREAIEQEVGEHRNRLYPPLTTLSLFIGQAISADGACQDAVSRHLSALVTRGQGRCSLSTGPYCQARQRLPLGLVRRLGRMVGQSLERASPRGWRWRGRTVKLVDGTTISMPDTASNQARYPQNQRQRPGLGFPLTMLVGIISLSTGAVLDYAHGPTQGEGTGEGALLRELAPSFQRGDVLLADRYYSNYFAVAMMRERGVDLLSVQHGSRPAIWPEQRTDCLVNWARPARPRWMSREQYQCIPKTLEVRQTLFEGRVLVSTLTDMANITAAELGALYQQRWTIEVDWRAIKVHMGMDVVRAKSADMVDKEIAVYLLAYNLMRALLVRAALACDVLPRALSFKTTMQLFEAFQHSLRNASAASAKLMCAHLLGGISVAHLQIRPGRSEPRAIKRRPKPHDLLTSPRPIARAELLSRRTMLGSTTTTSTP